MYLSDVCTIPSNLAGHPAMSVPFGTGDDGLPVGVQLLAPALGEATHVPGRRRARGRRGAGMIDHRRRDGLGARRSASRSTPSCPPRTKIFCALPEPLRRRAQHQHLPGVPRPARQPAGAQRAGGRAGHPPRRGPALRGPPLDLPPEELLLPGHAEGLPGQPVRPADQRRAAGSSCRRAPASASRAPTSRRTPASRPTSATRRPHPRQRRTRSSTTTAPACRSSRS